jgi:hypothetical protein
MYLPKISDLRAANSPETNEDILVWGQANTEKNELVTRA